MEAKTKSDSFLAECCGWASNFFPVMIYIYMHYMYIDLRKFISPLSLSMKKGNIPEKRLKH